MFRTFSAVIIIACVAKFAFATGENETLCGVNEVLSTCINSYCEYRKCSDIGGLIDCELTHNQNCKKGCKCIDTYLRADNGTCILASQCPNALKCTKENEYWDDCPATCPARTCNVLDNTTCSEILPRGDSRCPSPACRCKGGFYRTEEGECVLWDLCPKPRIVCASDEVITNNTNCERQYCSQPENVLYCVTPLLEEEVCHCQEGWLRNDDGVCISSDNCTSCETNTELENFQQGNAEFTLKFLYESAISNPDMSLSFSPFSILLLLAQLSLYASENTLQQLLQVLNLSSKHKIWSIIAQYMESLSSQQGVIYNTAGKVLGSTENEFSKSFVNVSTDFFKSEALNLNFSNYEESTNVINNWVLANTNNAITSVVSSDSFDQNTTLILLDAVYFKGDWKDKFNPTNTKQGDFYVNSNKKVTVNMMKRTGSYKYAEQSDLDAKILELPYEDEKWSLMIWLPNNSDGIYDLIEKLNYYSNTSLFSSVSNSLQSTKLDVSIPTFEITSSFSNLEPILSKANITEIFNSTSTGLSGLFKEPKSTKVSSVTHKTTIVVYEAGTASGVLTTVVKSLLGILKLSKNTEFNANRQFLYFVSYDGTPVISGVYTGQ